LSRHQLIRTRPLQHPLLTGLFIAKAIATNRLFFPPATHPLVKLPPVAFCLLPFAFFYLSRPNKRFVIHAMQQTPLVPADLQLNRPAIANRRLYVWMRNHLVHPILKPI
jgi:hypothetical protein